MKHKLHKDLEALLKFFQQQRQNPPAAFEYASGIVNKPEVFTVRDLQHHLNNPLLQPDWINLIVKGSSIALENACLFKTVQKKRLTFIDKSFVNQKLADGAAVVLEGLDILDPMINTLLARIDEKFPCVLSNCVAFFSQRDNEAYPPHCDTDDVLVFQLQGKKIWHLFEPQQRRYFGASNLNAEQLGPVKQELTLRPGDALYVRAGVPHRCLTPGDFSLHFSIDLGDRSPNVEQIAQEADKRYRYATAAAYGASSGIVERYVDVLQDPQFQQAFIEETKAKRGMIQQFRQQIGHASAINYLNKLK